MISRKSVMKKTPITAESLRFLILFMLMVFALQVFALLLASNVVSPEMILLATPQPFMQPSRHVEQDTWLGKTNITFNQNLQRPSIKIPIIPRFKPTPWN